MKNTNKFFSMEHFKELKFLLILEIVIISLVSILVLLPQNKAFIELNNITLFSPLTLLLSFMIWLITSVIDPVKYFNFAAFIISIFFSYWCFWFMSEIMTRSF